MPKVEDDEKFDWELRIKTEEDSMLPQMKAACWIVAAAGIVLGGVCGWIFIGWILGG